MTRPLASIKTRLLLALALAACAAVLAASSSRARHAAPSPPNVSGGSSALPSAARPAAVANDIRKLSLTTRDLIVDPGTQTIYASVPGHAGPSGNSLTPIDPEAGTLGTPVFVGSDPGKLAISDDRQYIYVGLDGEAGVRRFEVATQTAQLKFYLSAPASEPVFVQDIEVMPGAPQTVAVSRSTGLVPGSNHRGVAVYDDGVRRPTTSDENRVTNYIEFSASAATLYGFNSETTELGFRKLSITSAGVSIVSTTTGVLNEFGNIEFDGGLIYHAAGRVVNPETHSVLGAYTGMNFQPFSSASSVVVDAANNRVYFLAGGAVNNGAAGTARIYAFDKTTRASLGSYSVAGTTGRVGSLVRWGATGLAFRDETSVYLVPTPDSVPPPGPSPLPTPTPSGSPTPVPTPAPGVLRQIALPTNDLVVEPNTQNVFASVPASAGDAGNRLARIDPATGLVFATATVGGDPNKLAVSDDGQYIYVGLDGDNAVRRFEVATGTAGLQFPVLASSLKEAEDIEVMPGSPETVAIVRGDSDPEVAVYDNGVPRPLSIRRPLTKIEFSNSPGVLYGYNGATSAFEFLRMMVASCGVGEATAVRGLLNATHDFKYDNGRVYASNGRAIDPETGTLVGTFSVPPAAIFSHAPAVETDSKADRIYSLSSDGTIVRLRVFHMQTFVLLGELLLPGVAGPAGGPASLVRWGADGLAFRTPTHVYLLQHPLVAGTAAPFTPAPTASPSGFSVRGRVARFDTPFSGVTINYSGARTGTTVTDANGFYTIGDLPLCGSLTVTPSKTNHVFDPPSRTFSAPWTQFADFSAVRRTIGFVSTELTVNENSPQVFLGVERVAGGASSVEEVTFATADGTASGRSDYTAAFGRLRIDAGVAQTAIAVLLTDDVSVEGPETFTVTLQGVPAGYDLVNPTVTVTILDNDTTPPVSSPLQQASFFVRRHYQDFLGRDPEGDRAGFNFWVGQLNACNGVADPRAKADCLEERRVNVSAAFFLSIEFQQTGYFVQRLYAASFPDGPARPRGLPRFAEFMSDVREMSDGVIVNVGDWEQRLEQNRQNFTRRWVERAEFLAQFPAGMSAEQFVGALFANGGATPTDAERAAALAAYGGGGPAGRAAALRSVADSGSVFNRQYNRAFVLMQYFGYLRRNPFDAPEPTLDYAGFDFWLRKLDEFTRPGEDARDERVAILRVRRAEMVKSFLVSGEYMGRFGPENFNIRQ